MEIPEKVTLLFHKGCSRKHFTLGEIRKCAGRYIHSDSVYSVTYVVEKVNASK